MMGTSWFGRIVPIGVAVFVVFALVVNIPNAQAAELWDFIKVGKNFEKGVKWESQSGKAVVEIKKGQINIRVSYSDDSQSVGPDTLGYVSIKISGKLAPDNSIQATCVFLDTDANPVKLTGRYITREDLQIWGEKRKIVTEKEIVFSHPPNYGFFGFIRQDARDE
jgi:hypothetical protein